MTPALMFVPPACRGCRPGLDMVIFPLIGFGWVEKTQRRVQALTPDASTVWIDGDGQMPRPRPAWLWSKTPWTKRLQLGFPLAPTR